MHVNANACMCTRTRTCMWNSHDVNVDADAHVDLTLRSQSHVGSACMHVDCACDCDDKAALSMISNLAGLPCKIPTKTDWSSLQHQRDGNQAGTHEHNFCINAGLKRALGGDWQLTGEYNDTPPACVPGVRGRWWCEGTS